MRNISFDNPYLLLLAIPLLALLIVPYAISIKKDNKSKSVIASLVIHIVIVALVVLAAAGTTVTTVMTQTNVFVVADVSYSANRNLDKIDGYIEELSENLPTNSQMGVVCFGKDSALLTEMGGEIKSVKDASIDDSATNISDALSYTSTLFADGVIKRIVLITDGKETESDALGEFIGAVEALYAQNIYIDAIYVDSNIPEDAKEVQVSGVDFTKATYLSHEATADLLLQSSYDTEAILTLYRNGEKYSQRAVELTKGYNVTSFELGTEESGEYDYKVVIDAENDHSPHNNAYSFTQRVEGSLNVLLISSNEADAERARALYGEDAVIDAYINDPNIPCSIEQICKYDEILLSSVDLRTLDNFTAFVDAVDTAVSVFGKSLVTFGDLQIQNKTDEVFKLLQDMLPVKFGNNDQDPKLYTIVIDTSRSMQNAGHIVMAKESSRHLLGLLGDEDYVSVIAFAGDVTVIQSPTKAVKRDEIYKKIESIQPTQGTFLGKAMEETFKLMEALPYREKQVMLISDGMSYTLENDDPQKVAAKMRDSNIYTSVINTACNEGVETLENIAIKGGGSYYEIENADSIEELIFSSIADEMTESVILGQSGVNIDLLYDETTSGIATLPDINGYVYSSAKASATTVLSTEFKKAGGSVTNPPIYSYWSYGNGRVSSFTSALSGEWVSGWESGSGATFLKNVIDTNTPKERIDYPYTLSVEYDGTYANIELLPAALKTNATASALITFPDGSEQELELTFDSSKYFYSFKTGELGKYGIKITYAYDKNSFESESVFNISYSPEYNAFEVFDASTLTAAVRDRGSVSEESVPKLENDRDKVATYVLYFTVPFMIAAVVLYVVDIIIRKIKWADIKSLFVKTGAKGGNK